MAGIPLGGRRVDLDQLKAELVAAGVSGITSLGIVSDSIITYDAQGEPADLPEAVAAVLAAHTPSTALRDQLVSTLQGTVGKSHTDLSNAEIIALAKGLLFKAGGMNRQGVVRPLNQWLVP